MNRFFFLFWTICILWADRCCSLLRANQCLAQLLGRKKNPFVCLSWLSVSLHVFEMGLEDSPLGRQSVANVEKCSGSLFTATQAFYGSGNKWLRRALFSRQPREYVNSHDENAEGCPRPESGGRIINPTRDRKLFKTINNCTIREVMTKYTHTHTRSSTEKNKIQSLANKAVWCEDVCLSNSGCRMFVWPNVDTIVLDSVTHLVCDINLH